MTDGVSVSSLDELRQYLDVDDVRVRMTPGTYRLGDAASPNFLAFTGSRTHFDFTDVRIDIDTALFGRFDEDLNVILLSGNHIELSGLTLVTRGRGYAPGGCRAVSIIGNDVTIEDATLDLEGSYPYGYGSYFGIGEGAAITPRKINGIRVGGLNDTVIGCRVVMRGFGHAIFVRGGQNARIENCDVQGALRRTDDILAETSGLAYEQNFTQYTGQPIPAGRMTSLSEDGIRAYPDDPLIGRRTRDIQVKNCRVTRMRRGICLAFAGGANLIEGCEVTESERVGFHIGSHTTIRDSRGDARYTHLLDISSPRSTSADAELDVMDSRDPYGHSMLAKINGTGHRVVLTDSEVDAVSDRMTVELGTDKGFGQGRIANPAADSVDLRNETPASVVLHESTTSCSVVSKGPVRDQGTDNTCK